MHVYQCVYTGWRCSLTTTLISYLVVVVIQEVVALRFELVDDFEKALDKSLHALQVVVR